MDLISRYFIDTNVNGPDLNENVCKIVAIHCDDGATLIAENPETGQLWLTERSFLKPITEDEANAAFAQLANTLGAAE